MSDNYGMRVGESLVAGGPPGTAAEPEVIVGNLNGPFGTAFATLLSYLLLFVCQQTPL